MIDPADADADAARQLERELDEAPRAVRPDRNRVTYALPLVLVVSVIGGVAAYAITSLVVKFAVATTWAYVLSAGVIAILAWGIGGMPRDRATVRDRVVDLAVSVVVASLVFGLVGLPPLFELFSRMQSPGLDGVPRFHHIMGWSAIAACAAVAVTGFARLALERPRS
jgi:hypothetical protein